MSNSRIWVGIIIILTSLLFAACSNDTVNDEEKTLETEMPDETLFAVIETNVEQLMAKDLEGYMETIHSDSPVYETTEETITELFNYTLDIELQNLEIKKKSDEEAIVAYIQRTIEANAGEFQNNETVGEHTLRLDDGEWKIYHSEIIEVNPLPQTEVEQEEVEMTGEYSETMSNLAKPFDEEEWFLANYDDSDRGATAEYLLEGETLGNYSRIITYDFYKDGNELSGLAHFTDVLQESYGEIVTGEYDFSRLSATESEVVYHFTLTEDATEPNQEEIGRIFVSNDDLFVVRYTVMEESIEDIDEMINMLRDIQ